jgi:hypothetical protein
MKLEVGKNQGDVIIDDETGQILSVDVYNAVNGKFDSIATKSYSRVGDKHYKLEFSRDKDE